MTAKLAAAPLSTSSNMPLPPLSVEPLLTSILTCSLLVWFTPCITIAEPLIPSTWLLFKTSASSVIKSLLNSLTPLSPPMTVLSVADILLPNASMPMLAALVPMTRAPDCSVSWLSALTVAPRLPPTISLSLTVALEADLPARIRLNPVLALTTLLLLAIVASLPDSRTPLAAPVALTAVPLSVTFEPVCALISRVVAPFAVRLAALISRYSSAATEPSMVLLRPSIKSASALGAIRNNGVNVASLNQYASGVTGNE
ncbi:hypothetical protein D3C84_475320 [compost metagenome]